MNTVTSCTKLKEWSKDGKTVPIYTVKLSDGTEAESFGKEIPEGTPDSELEITEGQYGKKVKWNKPGAKGGFARQRAGNESFSLAYSKDWCIAQLAHGKTVTTDDMLKIADKLYNWLESKKQ